MGRCKPQTWGLGDCLQRRGSKSASATLDLLTFVWLCQQMRHGWSGPFHGHEIQPFPFCSKKGRAGGRGGNFPATSLCAAQDIELPLPLRDALNAPSGRRVTNRSKHHWGKKPGISCSDTSSLRLKPFRSPSYFSKHTRLLNITAAF